MNELPKGVTILSHIMIIAKCFLKSCSTERIIWHFMARSHPQPCCM